VEIPDWHNYCSKAKVSEFLKMKNPGYIRIFVIVFLSGLLFATGCDKQIARDAGFLEGVISIGPLCPVETDPPNPGCLPTAETYKAYPVSVWTPDSGKKITQINPSLDGSFSLSLDPGNYLIILENGQNKPGGSNLPIEVSITSQKKTSVSIDIDTGIR
jgi:hypothetical protein